MIILLYEKVTVLQGGRTFHSDRMGVDAKVNIDL